MYPRDAKMRGLSGPVVLEVVLSETGCVYDARVTKGKAPTLDVAALRAVSQWTFEPLTLRGKPFRSSTTSR